MLYSKSDYEYDQRSFDSTLENGTPLDLRRFRRLMVHDLCMTNVIETNTLGYHRLEDIKFALENPRQCYRTLLETSDYLMRVSPHYYKLNMLYSNMAQFRWGIDLYDVKDNYNVTTLKKSYQSLAARLEMMNLEHEFSKILKVLPYQDIYYGLLMENQNDFFIQQVDFRICKLYQIQDGLYNFAINLSSIKPQNLGAYPDYVQQAFMNFRDGSQSKWYSPPADKQICLKLNSHWTYPFPLLIGLIQEILDLEVYKRLKLQSARTDNYKAIMMQVPIDETTVDKPLLTPKVIELFAEMNKANMTDDIGLIHTLGSKGEAVSFKDSSNTRNNVADAVDDIYNSAGITKELYNGSSSGTAVTLSVENDAGIVYGVYRQLERYINRYIKLKKYNKSTFKFRFYLLDITIFNVDTVMKRYKDACALGATVVDKWMASLGMTPSRLLGSFAVHKDIFDFQNQFTPLASSFNTSTSDEPGRPSSEETGKPLDESGEITKSADSNIDR